MTTTQLPTDANKTTQVIKTILPVSELNLNKQRITERDLESIIKKNSTSNVVSTSNSSHMSPQVTCHKSQVTTISDQPIDLSRAMHARKQNVQQQQKQQYINGSEVYKQSPEHDALLLQILKTQLKKRSCNVNC